jgi:ribose transport system permease protein
VITGGAIVYPGPGRLETFQSLGLPTVLGGVTGSSLLLVAVAAVTSALQAGTTFGRRVYAVDGNPTAAWLSGIGVRRVRVGVFAISGVCAAPAGLVLAARGGSAQSDMGALLELTAIAATLIGGTSILGGQGVIWRGMVGVLILTLIGGWDARYRPIVEGARILAAVSLDYALRHGKRSTTSEIGR